MSIFFESVANANINATLLGLIDGEINIIEETIVLVEDYILCSIENAKTENIDFKPIKLNDNQFQPFKPRKVEG